MEIIIVAVIVVGALVLFALEWLMVDVVALLIMASLILTGILSPTEALTGFSNVATLTVLFMFIVSAALMRSGVLVRVSSYLKKSTRELCLRLIVHDAVHSYSFRLHQ